MAQKAITLIMRVNINKYMYNIYNYLCLCVCITYAHFIHSEASQVCIPLMGMVHKPYMNSKQE